MSLEYIVLCVGLALFAVVVFWKALRKRKPKPAIIPGSDDVAGDWEIGPVIDGANHSRAMPLHPTLEPDGMLSFELSPGKEAHYITYVSGPITGKTAARLRGKIVPIDTGAFLSGAEEDGKCAPGAPTLICLYFAHENNDWMNDGTRWWATPFAIQIPQGPEPFEFDVVVPLDYTSGWTSLSLNSKDAQGGFDACKAATQRFGFTMANCIGWGHGATAIGGRVKVTFDLELE